jgi:Flp pilus assembly protein TadD
MTRLARLAIPIAAAAVPALGLAGAEESPRQLMRFGVEAARQGLWREAVSRWERAVKQDAENPRLRNNLAVAYESLGRFADADREYREARRLAPDSLEVRDNHLSFLLTHPAFRLPDDARPAPAPKPSEPHD